MATGKIWDVENPLKPTAPFDPNAVRDIPFYWDLWLADVESTHASHEIICGPGLVCEFSSELNGIVKARIKADPLSTLVANRKYPVTCRMVAANGEQDDQTVWLKITQL